MALTRGFWKTIVDRAKKDPEFRLELLKEIMREAVKENPDIIDNAITKVDAKKKSK